MNARERWEGTPGKLLFKLCEIEGIDMKPDALTKELQRYRAQLASGAELHTKWQRTHRGRLIVISKTPEPASL